jgi:hypothetical protein
LEKFVDAETVLFGVTGTEYETGLGQSAVISSPQRLRKVGYPKLSIMNDLFSQKSILYSCRYMSMLALLAKLYIAGVSVSWEQFHTSFSLILRKVELPLYPFQKQRYWYPQYDKKDASPMGASIYLFTTALFLLVFDIQRLPTPPLFVAENSVLLCQRSHFCNQTLPK